MSSPDLKFLKLLQHDISALLGRG